MRKLPIAFLLTVLMTVLCASAFGQRSPQRTRGAKAAYGQPVDVWTTKKKAKKSAKKQKKKAARKQQATPLYRNRSKNPWVN
jgi:hypothetical protein